MPEITREIPTENKQMGRLYGISGWLILVLIGLIIMPIRNILYIVNDLMLYFEPEAWVAISTYGSDIYHPLFAPLIVLELVASILFTVFAVVLLVLMFKKNRLFPKLMIIYLISLLIYGLIDLLLANKVYMDIGFYEVDDLAQYDLYSQLFQVVIYSSIWIPYFIVSKRVKVTFYKQTLLELDAGKIEVDSNPNNNQQKESKASRLLGYVVSGISFLVVFLLIKWIFL